MGIFRRIDALRCRIWESDQVDGHVAEDALLVEDIADRLTDRHHVHVGQALLREEAASRHELLSVKLIHGTDDACCTVRLNDEADRRGRHLVT